MQQYNIVHNSIIEKCKEIKFGASFKLCYQGVLQTGYHTVCALSVESPKFESSKISWTEFSIFGTVIYGEKVMSYEKATDKIFKRILSIAGESPIAEETD